MDDDSLYDLAPVSSPPQKVISREAPPTLAYRASKISSPAKLDTDRVKNFHMPLALLAGGIVIDFIAALLQSRSAERAAIYLTAELFISTAVMLAGILIAARVRQINLGSFWVSVFKLAAISVAPGAVVALATPMLGYVPLGGLVGLAIQFTLYFALLGALLDLDESDTWYCVWVIFLVRLAVYFAMLYLLK